MAVAGRLEGKSAIVTGAASGIGAAAARRFAVEGAAVACADLDFEAAVQVATEIGDAGGVASALRVDVTVPEDCEEMATATLSDRGRIDILYANAGIGAAGAAHEVDLEHWQKVLDVNLTGAWLSVQAALPAMRAQKAGVILLQGSTAALVGLPAMAAYAAAKGGVVALARQLTADYAGEGVRVNAICPSTVPTPLFLGMAEERAKAAGVEAATAVDRIRSRHPVGRLGTVEDVAALATFLASDDAGWVAGGTYALDGGYTAV